MADGRTVLNGVSWPDGTVTPVPGMYLGVQDPDTLQFYPLPASQTPITGDNGLTVTTSPTSTTIGLGDITPTSVTTENLSFIGNSRVISGDFSNDVSTDRTFFKTSTPNDQTVVIARPNGTHQTAGWEIENNSTGVNCSGTVMWIGPTACGIQNYVRGTGSYLPFYLLTGVGSNNTDGGYPGLCQDQFGNVSIGGNTGLPINASSRFFYLNSMPGTPTVPPMIPVGNTGLMTGKTAITADVPNGKIYFYTNGMWRNTNTPDYQEFTATANQTIFNTQIRTLAKSGTKSFLQVFVNGILQQEGATKEYTVTGPTQITFNGGIAVDADVVVYGFA